MVLFSNQVRTGNNSGGSCNPLNVSQMCAKHFRKQSPNPAAAWKNIYLFFMAKSQQFGYIDLAKFVEEFPS